MSEENTNVKKVRMMESYTTYECHGDLELNFDIFPDLKDKSGDEIQKWLNENYSDLYVHCGTGELRKDKNYIYSPEDLEAYKEDGEEPEAFEDSEIIELYEYWSNSEVIWDKIKCEEKDLILIGQ